MRNRTRWLACMAVLNCTILFGQQANIEPITDHSGASAACGPVAIRWGFMCPIGARFHDHVYALNFTRPAGVAWNALTPIETPIAFWSRNRDGKWTSVLLDGPERTYQTPTLLIDPDGRASVFTLHPADSSIQWFRANDLSNTAFTRTPIPIGWGSYMSGAINDKGEAALVYWANGAGPIPECYPGSKLGCTLLNTVTGRSKNIIIDSPGAPYCYNQVFYNRTGLHIFGVRSIVVPGSLICGTRNHYTELRYYHCDDPNAADPKWQHVVIAQNDRGSFQPLGNVVDPSGRVHLLYVYTLDDGHGKAAGPTKLVYAVSREPVSATQAPLFVQHELSTPGDGRIFLTRDGAVYIVAYDSGGSVDYARVLDGVAGKFTQWKSFTPSVPLNRLFPIDVRNGSTPGADLEAIFIPTTDSPQKNSMYYFSLQPR
ncbi:MAG TPA: hypothetical protein VG722_06450 [Tepidisphaeraceae bacterium]|nr:hypothetical protein [Tepidisphaeraceae bacterium]